MTKPVAADLMLGSIVRVSQTVVTMAVAFIMMPFLVKELGDYWYGIWVVFSGLTAAYHISDLGMANAVARYVSYALAKNDSREANVTVNTALTFYTFVSLTLMIVSFVLAWTPGLFMEDVEASDTLFWIILITGVSVALEIPFNAMAGIPQARVKFHWVAGIRIFISIVGAIATYWVVSAGYGLIGMVIATFCVSRVSNLLFLVICKLAFRDLVISYRYFERRKLKEMLGFSVWSFLVGVANMFRSHMDSYIIAAFLSLSTVTIYAIGSRLVDYTVQLMTQATNMLTPILTKNHAENNHKRLLENVIFVSRINMFISVCAFLCLYLVGQIFIVVWMGQDYVEAYYVMLIIALPVYITYINKPLISYLYAVNHHRKLAVIDVVEIPIRAALSISLSFYYDMFGVAIGAAISLLIFRGGILPVVVCNQLGVGFWSYARSMIRPALLPIPFLMFLRWVGSGVEMANNYYTVLIWAAAAMAACFISFWISFSRAEIRRIMNAAFAFLK